MSWSRVFTCTRTEPLTVLVSARSSSALAGMGAGSKSAPALHDPPPGPETASALFSSLATLSTVEDAIASPPAVCTGATGAAAFVPPAKPARAVMEASGAAAICSRRAMRSLSLPCGSAPFCSSACSNPLMRSRVARMSETASLVTGAPVRKLAMSVSAAWVSASSRGNPIKPQVPLMV
jgi:hypothetical protein